MNARPNHFSSQVYQGTLNFLVASAISLLVNGLISVNPGAAVRMRIFRQQLDAYTTGGGLAGPNDNRRETRYAALARFREIRSGFLPVAREVAQGVLSQPRSRLASSLELMQRCSSS
jgi:hypothetical protein